MDPVTGLWIHGWEFDGETSGHGFARALWGRGNCWVSQMFSYTNVMMIKLTYQITLAIPMFFELVQLPPTDPTYRILISALTRQVDALLPLQDRESGLWRTLLVDSTSYVEVSATAGFVGGILKAIRSVRYSPSQLSRVDHQGLLPQEKYLKPAIDGLKGCLAVVQPNGAVAHVSKGTPVGRTVDFYKHIPRYPVPYGQSLVIVALVEWLRYAPS